MNILIYIGLALVFIDLFFFCHKRMGGCGRVHWISTNCKRKSEE